MEYRSTVGPDRLAQRLRAAKRPFVTTHFKPDGDALGSVLALSRALAACGAQVDAAVAGTIDRTILGLALPGEVRHAAKGPVVPAEGCDLAVVVDTGAPSQLEHCRAWLEANPALVVGIDHHANGSAICPERLVDASCASCTQVLVRVIDELGIPLGPATRTARHSIAEALFVGLATDTGWFRFSSADDRVFQLAARLLAAGVDKDALFRMVEQGDAQGRMQLVARALGSIEFCCEGRVSIMRLARADFEATGTGVDDLAGLVNEPMSVGSLEVSVLLTEGDPSLTKASFRSKPPASAGAAFVDVNQLAGHFDGGGHVHAAGARIAAPLAEAAARVRAACESYLESAGPSGVTA